MCRHFIYLLDMVIHPSHMYVNKEGAVSIPYLDEWKSDTSNLVELMALVASVFSHKPPLYTK